MSKDKAENDEKAPKKEPGRKMEFQVHSKEDHLFLIVNGTMIEVTEVDLRALRKFLKTGSEMAGDEVYGEIRFELEEW